MTLAMDVALKESKVIEELTKLGSNGDTEFAHVKADELIIDFLLELGYTEIAVTWKAVHKWYS